MREILTDKHFIASKVIVALKIVLVIALLTFFAPLFILPFFNHPCADDYISGTHLRDFGLYNYQLFTYENWGGRFAATFVGSLFVQNNYLYTHYYMHSILLLVLNLISTLSLIAALNRFVLHSTTVKKNIFFIALIFIALTVCCMPEPSTYIFWFSSAVTYQLPVILCQFELVLLLLLINTSNSFYKIICWLLLPFLVFTINGFNELFIIAQGFMLIFLFLVKQHKKLPVLLLILLLLAFFSSALIVILSPGNASRQSIIVPKGFITSVVAVLFELGEALFNIFKNPLFWFGALAAYSHAAIHKETYSKKTFVKYIFQRKILFGAGAVAFVIIAIAAAVLALKGGLLPDRYLDAVCYFIIVILIAFICMLGLGTHDSKYVHAFTKKQFQILLFALIIIGITCNNYVSEAYKSVIAAPVYNAIMTEREKALETAAGTSKNVIIPAYDKALQMQLDKDYSQSSQTLYNLVQQKPSLIFFQDDLSSDYGIGTLKNFYRIDSITVIHK